MSVQSAHERFLKSLPSDWDVKSLSDVGSIFGGSTPRRGVKRYWGGAIPWVTPGELTSLAFKYLGDSQEHITQAGLESCGAHLLPADTLLVTSRATIGAVALASRPISTNQGFKSVVFGPGTEPGFYFHLFKRLIPELTRRASGTTFLEISGREFGAVRVPVPPRSEQRRIAELLDTLDKAIRRTEQIIVKLKQIKQGLLHDLLTRGIDENGELRDPGRHPEQFKDSSVGRIPKQWDMVTLADVSDISKLAGFEYTNHIQYCDDGEIIAIRPLNIKNERIDLSDIQRIKRKVSDSLPRSKVRAGDVVLTYIGAYIGEVAIIEEDDRFHLAPNIARVRSKEIDPEFLLWTVRDHSVQAQFRRCTAVTATPSMTMASIRKVLIPTPPVSEQRHISQVVALAHNRQLWEEMFAAQMHVLKEGLVDDLLTGRVRVTKLEAAA